MGKDNGGSAFPTDYMAECPDCENQMVGATAHSGMTLRDYFMAHAPDVPQDYSTPHKHQLSALGIIIKWRNEYADRMVAERNEE